MINPTTEIINHLHAGGTFGHYWTAQDKRSTWFPAGDAPAPSSNQRDTYFGVHPTTVIPPMNRRGQNRPPSAVRSQIKHLAAVNCLFSEFDAPDQNGSKRAILDHLDGLPVWPSIVIDSGGGYHSYWLLKEPYRDIAKAQGYQYRWVKFTGGDGGSKDLARVLRVPGTRNLKAKYAPDFPTVTVIECDLQMRYNLSDLVILMPEPEPPRAPLPERALPTLTGDQEADQRARYWARALNTAQGMIARSTDGEKHTVLLKAGRLLGGYIAGGMGNQAEATDTLRDAIRAKSNVDSLGAAFTTIDSGIEYGLSAPITFEQRELERAAWAGRVQPVIVPGDRQYWTGKHAGAWGAMR